MNGKGADGVGRTIRQEQRDGVAILRLADPPSNTLTRTMRAELDQALSEAIADPGIIAILLTGLGEAPTRGLSAGLDLREAETGFAAPGPADLCRKIEDSPKPVVAVLHGLTHGAGVELALAAHARVATADASIGFPDVMMGLCPGAGATQILTRILGAQGALDLLLTQHPRLLRARALKPLVDFLIGEDDDAIAAALGVARGLGERSAAGDALRRSGDRDEGLADFAANAAAIAARRAQVALSPNIAGARIVDCIEAAGLLPYQAGLSYEGVAFQDLVASDLSKALRHAMFAERRAPNMPELARVPPATAPQLQQAGIVGGGAQGAGLAVACLEGNLPVLHFERDDAALLALEGRVEAMLAQLVKAGRIPEADLPRRRALWRGTTELADLARADLLIEVVADILSTKTQVMTALDRVAGEGTILATTSARHPIYRIAAATSRPAQVVGLRLPAPAHLTRLAEVIPGGGTSDMTVARVVALLRDRLRRIVVRSGTGGGGLGDPVMAALRGAGASMLRLGATPAEIDDALIEHGFAQGLFRQMDMQGLDACLARGRDVTARLALDHEPAIAPAYLDDLDRLVMAGRTGQGAGRGYFLWQDGQPHDDPAVLAILDLAPGRRVAQGPALAPEAIVLRAVAAMANAGARALRAGFALRPSDIDTVMINAHGFPRWHGGPMKAADLVGLFDILQALKRFTVEDPAIYTPDPGFAALIKEGETFDALNRIGRKRRTIPG